MAELTVGSLFSGIGGLDLGLERAGMRVIWQSEIDPYACKVLSKHWPEVVNHGNIKEINWKEVERPDVICGGYPCQPFSTAGKRRGEEDPRHLWPWVREAISKLRPRYAILENVRGHLSMGGLSVVAELASIGYDAEWRVVSAASVGANHRRDRIIIVAYPKSEYCNGGDNYTGVGARPETLSEFGDSCGTQAMAYPNNSGLHRAEINPTEGGFDALSGLGRCCEDVADTDNTRNRTPRCDIDGNGQAFEQGREVVAQSGSCRCSSSMAHPDRCDSSDGRQCEAVPSESGSRRNDRSGSGSHTGQISVGSTGQTSSDMADSNGRRCQQCKPETEPLQGLSSSCERNMADADNSRHVYTQKPWESDPWRRSPYSGFLNWEVEPDVGRVAHGVPSRVDRLRGLGNAVVPQVAEVIGRLVVAHAG